MNAMAPTRPTELHGCRVRLTAGPAAAAEARSQVRAAICAWAVPVDPSVALLLTSEMSDERHQARARRDRHARHHLLLRLVAR